MWSKRQISFGDRYVKHSALARVVWVVDRVVDAPGLPTHVRLVREGSPLDTITVSLYALGSSDFYRPVDMH